MQVRARRGSDSPSAPQRIVASLGYFLPLLDGVRYGAYLFRQYPITQLLVQPVLPLYQVYTSVPGASFVAFFGLYIAVVQNTKLSRYVRYNVMQAIILDVLLILPQLLERLFATPGGGGFGAGVIVLLYNTVFLFLFTCFAFGVTSCLLGRSPRLPIVADAADAQVPF